MPSSSAVHAQLTDILVRVVACPADAVVPDAALKELGTDSLTIVEVGEELGRRFDVYLSDETIDRLVTVDDAINAVVRHDGSHPPSSARVTTRLESPAAAVSKEKRVRRHGKVGRAAFWLVLVGASIGAIFGLGGAALVGATGISDVDLPPLTAPTTTSPTVAPSTTPTPTPTKTKPADPDVAKPTIEVSKDSVSPGERFILEGAFPAAGEGADLQVQVKDEGQAWDDFPIQTTTRKKGAFKTELYTSRTGKRQFRLTNKQSGQSTPDVTVAIG